MARWTAFVAYATALSIAAIIPGPGVAALVGQSLGNGLRASLFFLFGLALGDVLYLTIAIAGLAAIAKAFAGAFLIVKILGGAYLIYLAYRFWTSKSGPTQINKVGRQRGLGAMLTGFVVTLGNPKTIVFYLALLPTVLDLESVGFASWAVLSVLTIIVLFITLTPYVFLAMKARGLMGQSNAIAKLNKIAAGIIGTTGIFILGQALMSASRRA